MHKERLETLISGASFSLLALILLGSFSRRTRSEIKLRADYECEECKKVGKHKPSRFHALECSHINHQRGPKYDKPETGKLLCLPHHYVWHLMHEGRAHEIGLSENNNRFAVDSIWKKMDEKERKEAKLLMELIVYKQIQMFATA